VRTFGDPTIVAIKGRAKRAPETALWPFQRLWGWLCTPRVASFLAARKAAGRGRVEGRGLREAMAASIGCGNEQVGSGARERQGHLSLWQSKPLNSSCTRINVVTGNH
jgi:hypothetical protein